MQRQLRMQFGNSTNQITADEFEDAKEDNFYNDHTLVFTKNPDNRKHTPDDILQDNLEMYFEQNGVKPNDTEFENTFQECRSLCKNCVFFDKLCIRENLDKWQEHLGDKKDKDFGTCCANPPTVVAAKNWEDKDSHKTVLPFVYLNTYCRNFYHRASDHRGRRHIFGYWGNRSSRKSSFEC